MLQCVDRFTRHEARSQFPCRCSRSSRWQRLGPCAQAQGQGLTPAIWVEKGWRECDSQVTCHLNSVHALAFMDEHSRHTHHPLVAVLVVDIGSGTPRWLRWFSTSHAVSPSFVGKLKLSGIMGAMDEKDIYAVAAPVVDSGSGMCYACIAGCGSPRGIFPSVVVRPKMVDIMADMTRRTAFCGLVRSPSTPAVACAWLVLLGFFFAMSSLQRFAGPDARHHGRYEPEGLFRARRFWQWHVQGSFHWYFTPCAVFLPWLSSPDARLMAGMNQRDSCVARWSS